MKRNWGAVLLLVVLVVLLAMPVHAQSPLGWVTDEAGLLSETERQELERRCEAAAVGYGCGVYIITVEDFRDHGSGDVFDVTYELYHEYLLGVGSDRDGVLLLLSMAERDYALFVYGDGAEYAIDSHGQRLLEDAFLPPFGDNDWYGGFRAYTDACLSLLEQAAAGSPARAGKGGPVALAIGISFLISLLVCLFLKRGMKNVAAGTGASVYVTGELALSRKIDQFTHMTTTRTKIETKSTAHSGGGGSGRSGKF